MIELVRPDSPELWAAARRLVADYAASLDVALDFQDFDRELENLPGEYGVAGASFLLARDDHACVGCGGVRAFSESACEMKRLYVEPRGQHRGIGRMLATRLLTDARALGYTTVLLDTLPSMESAQRLYRSLGFTPVRPYRFNPLPGATFLKLDL